MSTNHAAAARDLINSIDNGGSPEWDQTSATLAQAHASLAIAEQLAIANSIALIAARPGAAASPDVREALDAINDHLAAVTE